MKIVTSKGIAKKQLKEKGTLEPYSAWFGYGFSDHVYSDEKVDEIVAWGIENTQEFLVIIPDQFEITNTLARDHSPTFYFPFFTQVAGSHAQTLRETAQQRKENLQERMLPRGYDINVYNVVTSSELGSAISQGELQGLLNPANGIEVIEGTMKDMIEQNQKLFHDLGSVVQARQRSSILDKIVGDCKNQKEIQNSINWLVQYPFRQVAFTVYLALELGYPIKIGPISETPYDKIVRGLFTNRYSDTNFSRIFNFNENKLGMVYVEN